MRVLPLLLLCAVAATAFRVHEKPQLQPNALISLASRLSAKAAGKSDEEADKQACMSQLAAAERSLRLRHVSNEELPLRMELLCKHKMADAQALCDAREGDARAHCREVMKDHIDTTCAGVFNFYLSRLEASGVAYSTTGSKATCRLCVDVLHHGSSCDEGDATMGVSAEDCVDCRVHADVSRGGSHPHLYSLTLRAGVLRDATGGAVPDGVYFLHDIRRPLNSDGSFDAVWERNPLVASLGQTVNVLGGAVTPVTYLHDADGCFADAGRKQAVPCSDNAGSCVDVFVAYTSAFHLAGVSPAALPALTEQACAQELKANCREQLDAAGLRGDVSNVLAACVEETRLACAVVRSIVSDKDESARFSDAVDSAHLACGALESRMAALHGKMADWIALQRSSAALMANRIRECTEETWEVEHTLLYVLGVKPQDMPEAMETYCRKRYYASCASRKDETERTRCLESATTDGGKRCAEVRRLFASNSDAAAGYTHATYSFCRQLMLAQEAVTQDSSFEKEQALAFCTDSVLEGESVFFSSAAPDDVDKLPTFMAAFCQQLVRQACGNDADCSAAAAPACDAAKDEYASRFRVASAGDDGAPAGAGADGASPMDDPATSAKPTADGSVAGGVAPGPSSRAVARKLCTALIGASGDVQQPATETAECVGELSQAEALLRRVQDVQETDLPARMESYCQERITRMCSSSPHFRFCYRSVEPLSNLVCNALYTMYDDHLSARGHAFVSVKQMTAFCTAMSSKLHDFFVESSSSFACAQSLDVAARQLRASNVAAGALPSLMGRVCTMHVEEKCHLLADEPTRMADCLDASKGITDNHCADVVQIYADADKLGDAAGQLDAAHDSCAAIHKAIAKLDAKFATHLRFDPYPNHPELYPHDEPDDGTLADKLHRVALDDGDDDSDDDAADGADAADGDGDDDGDDRDGAAVDEAISYLTPQPQDKLFQNKHSKFGAGGEHEAPVSIIADDADDDAVDDNDAVDGGADGADGGSDAADGDSEDAEADLPDTSALLRMN
eukprot:PLAT12521.1.p1 GENE.PLAT12521.1~~PLAT12521.1.p1  ORF type:complete len:1026 (+),score=595.82 PLAT12521.1:46-3123(+)